MKTPKIIFAAVLGGLLAAGCDGVGGGAPAVFIDLVEVARETGQDEIIQLRAQTARDELGQQLQQVAADLDAQINAEREKAGENPTAEQEQQLQLMTMQARQQLSDVQAQAQAQASQIEQSLVDEFRAELLPLAQEIAAAQGARIVMAKDAYLLWYDDSLDITAQVIAAWQARSAAEVESSEDMVELEEQLEEVEEELTETQQELEELQETVEEAEAPAVE